VRTHYICTNCGASVRCLDVANNLGLVLQIQAPERPTTTYALGCALCYGNAPLFDRGMASAGAAWFCATCLVNQSASSAFWQREWERRWGYLPGGQVLSAQQQGFRLYSKNTVGDNGFCITRRWRHGTTDGDVRMILPVGTWQPAVELFVLPPGAVLCGCNTCERLR